VDLDVLFENRRTADRTLAILRERGLIRCLTHYISYGRTGYEDGAPEFIMLSPFALRIEHEAAYGHTVETEKPESILVRNMEELGYLTEKGYRGNIIADFHLYTFNRDARETLGHLGISADTVPMELNLHEINDRGTKGSILVIYGRTPLMVSAQCVNKTESGKCVNKKNGFFTELRDRKNTVFPVRADCDYCTNIIYNSVPLCLFKDLDVIMGMGFKALRVDITTESPEEAADIIENAVSFIENGFTEGDLMVRDYTRGHFRKGVD